MTKPERILEAALAVIAEKGPHETTIDEIAQRAGVAKGTVYLYFRTKEALMASLIESGLDAFIAAVKGRVEAQTGPTEKLRALIAEHVAQMHSRLKLGRIIWSQTAAIPLELKNIFHDRAKLYADFLAAILEAGRRDGTMQIIDPRITARAIIGSINQAIIDFSEPQCLSDEHKVVEVVTLFIENGVKSGGKTDCP